MTGKGVFDFAEELGFSVPPEDAKLIEFLLMLDAESEELGTERLQGANLFQRNQCVAAMKAGETARLGIDAYKDGRVLEAYRFLAQALPHLRAAVRKSSTVAAG